MANTSDTRTDLIRREDALAFPFANGRYDHQNANEHFINGCETYREWLENVPAVDAVDSKRLGRWAELKGNYLTPGGTPCYACGSCGGSAHLHGVEYPRRKMICDNCGRVNIYPWERAYEEASSLWEMDGGKDDALD